MLRMLQPKNKVPNPLSKTKKPYNNINKEYNRETPLKKTHKKCDEKYPKLIVLIVREAKNKINILMRIL